MELLSDDTRCSIAFSFTECCLWSRQFCPKKFRHLFLYKRLYWSDIYKILRPIIYLQFMYIWHMIIHKVSQTNTAITWILHAYNTQYLGSRILICIFRYTCKNLNHISHILWCCHDYALFFFYIMIYICKRL